MPESGSPRGVNVVKAVGRLDATTTPKFEQDVQECLASGATHVVIDLAGCEYASSTALRVLLVGARTVMGRKGGFAISGARPYVLEVLEVAGFTSIIPVYDTEAAAVAALQA